MFIAAHLLQLAAGKRPYKHSAVFDMESFFWTFLYVLFHQKRSTLDAADEERFQSMHPSDDGYKTDSVYKLMLLVALAHEGVNSSSILRPLQPFISDLASKAYSLYVERNMTSEGSKNIEVYSEEKEVEAIKDYIDIFEQLRSFLYQL